MTALKKLLSDDVGRLVVNSQHNASHIVEGLCALRECWLACVDDGFGANYLRCQYLPLSDELDEPDNGKATHWFRAVTSLCVRAQESPESAVVGELSSNVFFQVGKSEPGSSINQLVCRLGRGLLVISFGIFLCSLDAYDCFPYPSLSFCFPRLFLITMQQTRRTLRAQRCGAASLAGSARCWVWLNRVARKRRLHKRRPQCEHPRLVRAASLPRLEQSGHA
jgi:hypothetical protein